MTSSARVRRDPLFRVYAVSFRGVTAHVKAASREGAKAQAMRSARNAGYWSPGDSLQGLTCALSSEYTLCSGCNGAGEHVQKVSNPSGTRFGIGVSTCWDCSGTGVVPVS